MELISYFTVCGNKIHPVSISTVLQKIQTWINNQNMGNYVIAANTHMVMESRKDEELKTALEMANFVTPDGMPLVWLGRIRGFPLMNRTDGPNLITATLDAGQDLGWRHYFYGSTKEILEGMQSQISTRWPKAMIAGCFAPPFRTLNVEEDQDVINKINAAKPDILWVGLGCPKQEKWMAEHCSSLNVPVSVGVGQAFDLLARVKNRAPLWMQSWGLEWLFRLVQEPRRLWYRYLIYNTQFIYLVAREQIQYWFEK